MRKVEHLEISISEIEGAYLDRLLDSGLFGSSVEEVAERLIAAEARRLIEVGFLPRIVPAEPDTRPKCTSCGSPNLTDLGGMGGSKDVQCQDCNRVFAL